MKPRAAIAVVLALAAGSASALLTDGDYAIARRQLLDLYKAEHEACAAERGAPRELCERAAAGRQRIAMAHLQHQRSGDPADLARLADVRLQARYEVAREVCDEQRGDAKKQCLQRARDAFEQARQASR